MDGRRGMRKGTGGKKQKPKCGKKRKGGPQSWGSLRTSDTATSLSDTKKKEGLNKRRRAISSQN